MGIVMGDEGLAWYWLSHPSWQDHSQLGQSAGLFWQNLSPCMSTHSRESFWKVAPALSGANDKIIYYISVWWLVSTSPSLWEVRSPLQQRSCHGVGAVCPGCADGSEGRAVLEQPPWPVCQAQCFTVCIPCLPPNECFGSWQVISWLQYLRARFRVSHDYWSYQTWKKLWARRVFVWSVYETSG